MNFKLKVSRRLYQLIVLSAERAADRGLAVTELQQCRSASREIVLTGRCRCLLANRLTG
jgi:hypothetical protein